ncbi:TadG family pilus assembly protein [Variovorax sp. efr-133-TYG-130]|uniref:TadG family pilus assembly protein n=1 Tax=Variovorax sp. efr-133-TYG-130 TaxID=3040327 RepID=UPI002553C7E8|nr:TadG family pilus assembly protein [Variovorax sp. efr-133-TYG-130]
MWPLFQRSASHRNRQRGSVLVNAAIALSLIIITLVGTEIGYLFFLKREFQKSADLAALSGAQALTTSSCAEATTAAISNASQNLPTGFQLNSADVVCGRWDPSSIPGPKYFSAGVAPFNGVQISLQRTPPMLLTGISGGIQRQIQVQALAAKDEPSVVFSVGAKLADVSSGGALTSILKIAGVNVDNACVGCYTGLVTANISAGDLLSALGIPVSADLTVGGLNALLAAKKVSIGQLVNVIATLANQSGLLTANAQLLGALANAGINVDSLLVQVGTDSAATDGARGLFTVIKAPTTSAALNTQINAFDLLKTALSVGTSQHAVTLNQQVGALGLNVEARVIEPASIGIGGVGTTAYNSQVRVFASINTNTSIVGGILSTLATQITLPISIDIGNSLGTVTNIDCSSTPTKATIKVDAPLLSACIGQISSTALWSKSNVCQTDLQPMSLVRILGVDLLAGKAYLPALPNSSTVVLSPGDTVTTGGNPLVIGTTVSALLSDLLKLLLGNGGSGSGTPATRPTTPAIAATLASHYIPTTVGASMNQSAVDAVQTALTADGLTWNRPTLLGILSQSMPSEWAGKVASCKTSFSSYQTSCVRSTLVDSLQTANQSGLLTGILSSLVQLVSGLLGVGASDGGTPLLAGLLGPLVNLLQPALDVVGKFVSDLLQMLLGLQLGQTDVHLNSISCRNSKLVY